MVALMEIDFRGRMDRRGRGGGIISALMMTHSQLMSQSFTCNIVSYQIIQIWEALQKKL